MTAEEIAALAAALRAAGLDRLDLDTPEVALRLRLDDAPPAASPVARPASLEARGTGLFLPAHPASGTPMARPGQRLRAGAIVAFLQAGPLLQPVTAPEDGVLGACLATPLALVGFGTPLFAFHPGRPAP